MLTNDIDTNRKSNSLLMCLFGVVITDIVSGYIIAQDLINLPVGQFYKLVYMSIGFIYILLYLPEASVLLLASVIIFCIPSVANINKITVDNLIEDLIFYIKILTFPIMYTFFKFVLQTAKHPNHRVISLSIFAVLFSLLGSVLGFGLSTYRGGIGYKGYFVSGNELSALMLVLWPAFTFIILTAYKRGLIKKLLLVSIVPLSGILIFTKTAVIGSVLSVLLVYVLVNRFGNGTKNPRFSYEVKVLALLLLAVGVFLFFVLFNLMGSVQSILLSVIEARGTLIEFIFSGRLSRAMDSLNYIAASTPFALLFGNGWSHSLNIMKAHNPWGHSEIDLIDILMSNGIIGVIIIYSFWIYLIYKSLYLMFKIKKLKTIPSIVSGILLFINSFIAGHIMYSAMAGFFLAYVFAEAHELEKNENTFT